MLLYICACVGCLMIASCSNNCSDIRRRVTFYEQGDFRYAIQPVDAEPDDELYIMLDGLTEYGKSKKVVIIPEKNRWLTCNLALGSHMDVLFWTI